MSRPSFSGVKCLVPKQVDVEALCGGDMFLTEDDGICQVTEDASGVRGYVVWSTGKYSDTYPKKAWPVHVSVSTRSVC